jgi:YesN/AraC family two-component response regulator
VLVKFLSIHGTINAILGVRREHMINIKDSDFLKYSKEIRVLYVEDSVIQCKITHKIIHTFFKTFDIAHDGKEGLNKYLNGKYDLVITDINMPELNGKELVKRIRKKNPDQYIVVTSSNEDSETLIDFINESIDLFILKPLNLEKIKYYLYRICKHIDKEKELEILKQKRVFDSFVVTANHEINQHLGVILGNLQLCFSFKDECITEKNEKYLNKIKSSSHKIADVLKKMRELNSLEFIEYAAHSEMVDIHKGDNMKKDEL